MSDNPTYNQQPQYQSPQPGLSAPYAQAQPDPPQPSYADGYKGDAAPVAPQWYNEKNQEYGTVMRPKKKQFNDIIFLILFLLTVRPVVDGWTGAHWTPGRRIRSS